MSGRRGRGRAGQEPVDGEQITRAAARLFRRNGYDSTTMQDIASDLGILKGSLYHHITSKEDLLIDMLSRAVGAFIVAVREISASDDRPEAKLRKLIRAEILSMLVSQEEVLIWLAERGRHPAVSQTIDPQARQADKVLREVLELGASQGEWPATDISLAYLAIRGMITAVPTWYRPNGRYSPEEIAERVSDYSLRLLGASQGAVQQRPCNDEHRAGPGGQARKSVARNLGSQQRRDEPLP